MRFRSKHDLLDQIRQEHDQFLSLAATIPETQYEIKGVWGDNWTIKDLFAHLTEWEQMFLHWYAHGLVGEIPQQPTEGFKWNQTPALNRVIWRQHAATPWGRVRQAFDQSYQQIIDLVEELTEVQLLEPGYFSWTGKLPLASYLGPNTGSHYRTATKFLTRWLKQQKENAHA